MDSKQQKRVTSKAFRLFLAAVLLAALVGMAGVACASDGAGNALDFDGTDDYVEIPDNAALDANLANSFTVEAWIRTREDDDSMIFAKHSGGDYGSYYLATRSGGVLQLTVLTSSGREDHTVNFSYTDGKWHHVAGVYNGSNLTIYVDGAQVGGTTSQTGNVNDTTYPVRIGFYDGSSDWFYNGLYDEIRLWDDARTQAEIQANMYKTLAGSESGLVGYWKLDESSGTTATDSKGGNDGTLNNMEDSDWITSGAFTGPRNALSFDGSDDDVSVTDPSALQITGDLTIEAWVYADAIRSDEWQNVIVRCDGDGSEEEVDNYVYALLLQDNATIKTLWEYGSGSNEYNTSTSSNPSVTTGSWFHVAMARDVSDNELRIYINGSQLGSTISYTNDPSGGSNGNFHIGGNEFGDNFDGMIDEVRIWNDVRTQTEIQDNMFRTLDGDESGLVAYYRFDYGTAEGSNSGITTLYDLTSSNNDGTLNNFALTGSTSNWVSSSTFNTWIGSEGTGWSTAGNWSRGSAPTSTDNVGIYSYTGGNSPSTSGATTVNHLTIATDATLACGGNLTVNGNLSIASGGTMETGTHKVSVSGSTTNNGTLSDNETYELTLDATTVFSDGLDSPAAAITPATTNPGTTVVTTSIGSTIPANAFGSSCPAASSSVKRYYNVTADTSTGLNVTLRLYYDDAELNGNAEGSLDVYHCEGGSWVKEDGTYSRDGSNNYVEVTGVDSFSPFILGDSGPTAVTLARFTARPAVETWFRPTFSLGETGFLAALVLVVLAAVGGALLRERGSVGHRRHWNVPIGWHFILSTNETTNKRIGFDGCSFIWYSLTEGKAWHQEVKKDKTSTTRRQE
jgi:hypothetical protein